MNSASLIDTFVSRDFFLTAYCKYFPSKLTASSACCPPQPWAPMGQTQLPRWHCLARPVQLSFPQPSSRSFLSPGRSLALPLLPSPSPSSPQGQGHFPTLLS